MSKIEFNIEDIVRSGLVRSYLVSKINQGYNEKVYDHSELLDSVTLKRGLFEGRRLYSVGDNHYPSVTTVLSNRNQRENGPSTNGGSVSVKQKQHVHLIVLLSVDASYHTITEHYIKNILDLDEHKRFASACADVSYF